MALQLPHSADEQALSNFSGALLSIARHQPVTVAHEDTRHPHSAGNRYGPPQAAIPVSLWVRPDSRHSSLCRRGRLSSVVCRLGVSRLPSAVCRLPSVVCRLSSAVWASSVWASVICHLPSAFWPSARLPSVIWRLPGQCGVIFVRPEASRLGGSLMRPMQRPSRGTTLQFRHDVPQ